MAFLVAVRRAARYWNIEARQLSPDQAARLAAILPNPHVYKVEPPSAYVRERARWILPRPDPQPRRAGLSGRSGTRVRTGDPQMIGSILRALLAALRTLWLWLGLSLVLVLLINALLDVLLADPAGLAVIDPAARPQPACAQRCFRRSGPRPGLVRRSRGGAPQRMALLCVLPPQAALRNADSRRCARFPARPHRL